MSAALHTTTDTTDTSEQPADLDPTTGSSPAAPVVVIELEPHQVAQHPDNVRDPSGGSRS